jgi:prepilin-type N-terminal cleavage/methylation domain-containing protein
MVRHKETRGFTLLELIVVITVFTFVVTGVIVAFDSTRKKSRDAKRLVDVKNIVSALDLYYNSQKTYPAGKDGLPGDISDTCLSQPANNVGFKTGVCEGQEFMKIVPKPLPSGENSVCNVTDNIYSYAPIGTVSSYTNYQIEFCLETSSIQGLSSGKHTISPSGIK